MFDECRTSDEHLIEISQRYGSRLAHAHLRESASSPRRPCQTAHHYDPAGLLKVTHHGDLETTSTERLTVRRFGLIETRKGATYIKVRNIVPTELSSHMAYGRVNRQ